MKPDLPPNPIVLLLTTDGVLRFFTFGSMGDAPMLVHEASTIQEAEQVRALKSVEQQTPEDEDSEVTAVFGQWTWKSIPNL